MLTQERLKSILVYEPSFGVFTWSRLTVGRSDGRLAGYVNKQTGQRRIKIDYVAYNAADLAFLYVNGRFPKTHLKHIDQYPANCAWANLQE